MEYPSIGNIARLTGWFKDVNHAPADPSTVVVVVKDPGGEITIYTPEQDSVGVYHYDLMLTEPGSWGYEFVGTGAVTARTGVRHLRVRDAIIPVSL